jgi:hypothetical protein
LNTPTNENNVVDVTGTPSGTEVEVNLGPGTNHVQVGSTSLTLASIKGPVLVNGQSGKDQLVLDDKNGSPTLSYTINASSVASSQSAAIQFRNIALVTLIGGKSDESYEVKGIPANPVAIHAQGGANLLVGPNHVNGWYISGGDAGALDKSITFTDIQNLTGGNLKDTFSFAKAGALSGFLLGQAPSSVALIEEFSQANATLQVLINLAVGQSLTLLGRYNAGADSWYGAELVPTLLGFEPVIYRRRGGVITVLKTGALIPSASGTLAFKVIGSSLGLYLNNKLLVTASDTVLTTGGAAVLFGPGVSVSGFTVS